MSLDLRPVQVRLGDDAYRVLAMLAAAHDKDLGEIGRELLTRALLGEGHAVMVAAERLTRATTCVNARQAASTCASVAGAAAARTPGYGGGK